MVPKWSVYLVQHNFAYAPVVYPALKLVWKQGPHGRRAIAPIQQTIQMSPKDQTSVMTQVLAQDQDRDQV